MAKTGKFKAFLILATLILATAESFAVEIGGVEVDVKDAKFDGDKIAWLDLGSAWQVFPTPFGNIECRGEVQFYADGAFKKFTCRSDKIMKTPGGDEFLAAGTFGFYESGAIACIEGNKKLTLSTKYGALRANEKVSSKTRALFYDSGRRDVLKPKKVDCNTAKCADFCCENAAGKFSFKSSFRDSEVLFFESGEISAMKNVDSTAAKTKIGNVKIAENSTVTFWESGQVRTCKNENAVFIDFFGSKAAAAASALSRDFYNIPYSLKFGEAGELLYFNASELPALEVGGQKTAFQKTVFDDKIGVEMYADGKIKALYNVKVDIPLLALDGVTAVGFDGDGGVAFCDLTQFGRCFMNRQKTACLSNLTGKYGRVAGKIMPETAYFKLAEDDGAKADGSFAVVEIEFDGSGNPKSQKREYYKTFAENSPFYSKNADENFETDAWGEKIAGGEKTIKYAK